MKTLLAVLAAAAMVAAATVGRGALETKKESDAVRLTVACDPLARAFCEAAAAADKRITLRVEPPDVTTKHLLELGDGERPDVQAWVTVGPWLQMAVGKPAGKRLQQEVAFVASTPVVLVTKRGQNLGDCGKPPAGCLPLPTNPVGLPSPRSSGVGLAGLAQIVMARTDTAAEDLSRANIESGDVAAAIDAVAERSDPIPRLGEVNANFARANPVVITQAEVPTSIAAAVITSDPKVRAVLQVGFLDDSARLPLGPGDPAGRALAKAATDARWDSPGDRTGGLPDPGVLAALQDAWTGP